MVLGGLAAATAWTAAAQSGFPSRSLRVIVPFAAGGVGDLTARVVGQKLGELLAQPVVVENRPGAGGVVAGEMVARSEPDGHTLLLMSNGTAVSAGLFRSLPFDTVRDFTPVSTLGHFDIAILAPIDSTFRTLGDVVAFAKGHPGKLNLGSVNLGSTQHLTAELFKSAAGVDVQVVPFNGTPALVGALRSRQVDIAVEILGPVLPQVRAGALRVLAVTGERRSPVMPEVPTAIEAGVTGLTASSWNALAVPSRTPRATVDQLQRAIVTALADADVQKKLRDLNVEARSSSPEQASALLAADIRRWGEVIVRARIPLQQ